MYLLSYYCAMNPYYTNMFNHYIYLAVEDSKSANLVAGHVLSDKWNPYYYVKESGYAIQPKEKDVEKVGTAFEESTLIKSTVKKPLKSPRMMLKLSKMNRMFKWKFPMQLLKKK